MSADVPSLKRNVSWTFGGNVVFASCQWGILSALTKLGTPDIVGRFALASAVATPVVLFSNLQLRDVMASDARGDYAFGEYLALRLSLLPAALLVVVAVAVFGYTGPQAVAITLFGLARCVEGVSDIFYGYAQKNERMELIARSLGIKGPAALLLFGGTFAATHSLAWALAAMILGWALPLFVFDMPNARRLMSRVEGRIALRPVWRAASLRSLSWLALPLGVTMLLIQLRNTIPRTFLEGGHGEAELGIFSAMAYLVAIGNTVIMALSQSSIPRLAKAHVNGRGFARLVRRLLLISASMGIAGILVARFAGRPLLTILYSREYALHQDVFILIMIAGGLYYIGSILGAPATAIRAYRAQMWIQGVHVALLLGLAVLLIPGRGMAGAAWTMIGGAAWVAAAYAVVVVRKYRAAEKHRAGGEAVA